MHQWSHLLILVREGYIGMEGQRSWNLCHINRM